MHQLRTAGSLLLASCVLAACSSTPPPNQQLTERPPAKDCTDPAPPAESPAPPESREAHSARLEQREGGGRALHIINENGTVLETLAPEEFTQTLSVPDIEHNSMEMIPQEVTGTDIVAASVDPPTGRILVAVRGFIYAEVSTDLVFLLSPRKEEGTSRAALPIYFDGPKGAASSEGPRPHLDVSAVSFNKKGQLVIHTADASGGSCELTYDSEGVPQSCTWKGGESRRCPHGLQAPLE